MTGRFHLFHSKQLKPIWELRTNALIWRIIFSPSNTIIGETRDQAKKNTSFFCVDSATGKVLWKEMVYGEPWWIGIETIYDRWMILHGYTRPDMPEHHGVRIIDLMSGKMVWQNEDISYWFIHNQKLYAHKYVFEKRIGYEIDISNGSVLQEYSQNLEVLHDLRKTLIEGESKESANVTYAEHWDPSEEPRDLKVVVDSIVGENVLEGWIEYFKRNNILVLSYYRKIEKSEPVFLENILSIYDTDEHEVLFEQKIGDNLQIPTSDTFFMKNDFVYYINNSHTLTALRPWK